MFARNLLIISLILLLVGCGLTSKDVLEETAPKSTTKIYVITDRGLSCSTDNGKGWEGKLQKSKTNNIPSTVFNNLAVDGHKYYLATDKGLAVSTDNMKTFVAFLENKKTNTVYLDGLTVLVAAADGCYLATENMSFVNIFADQMLQKAIIQGQKIYALENKNIKVCTMNVFEWSLAGELKTAIKDFAVVGHDLYVLTEDGFYCNFKKIEIADAKNFKALFIDVAKNIFWLAAYNGVYKSADKGQSWVVYDKTSGLDSFAINDIYVDNLNIYLATDSGLKHSVNAGETWRSYKKTQGLLSNKILKVLIKK